MRRDHVPYVPASRHDRKKPQTELRYADLPKMEVTGASMAPTLLGRHIEASCSACGVVWPAYGISEAVQSARVICWNCGSEVTLDATEIRRGKAVRLVPRTAAESAFTVGELVAVGWPQSDTPDFQGSSSSLGNGDVDDVHVQADELDTLSVKRIVAGPGQVVTHRSGQLLVDAAPILPERIWLPVHNDAHRNGGQSWWIPQPDGEEPSVEQTAGGFRMLAIASDADSDAEATSDWLVYHHRSVHHGMRPDRVRDDVPGNVTEVRALLPVSRLRLSLRVEATWPGRLEAAFWDGVAVTVRRVDLLSGTTHLEVNGPRLHPPATSATADSVIHQSDSRLPDLSEHRPIAIRVVAGAVEITQVRIDRPLEYRIDPRLAATVDWPIELAADQYFLLGDNVPLSIDSRHFGPVAGTRIVGRIQPVSYDDSRR